MVREKVDLDGGAAPMANPTSAPSTADEMLLSQAPQMLSDAYRRARLGLGGAGPRLAGTIGFVDLLLRYLVGVLGAELAGTGVAPPKHWKRLLEDKIQTPSLGDWSRAGEAMATALLTSGAKLVAPEFAGVFVAQGSDGGCSRTAAGQAIVELIEVRNSLAHSESPLVVDPARADTILAAIERPFSALREALQFLVRYPLLCVDRFKQHRDCRWGVSLWRFQGRDPDEVEAVCDDPPLLPDRLCFLTSCDGHVLFLDPFVVVAQHPQSGVQQVRVAAKYAADEKAWLYSALDGGAPNAVLHPCGPPPPPRAVIQRAPDHARRERGLPQQMLDRLFDARPAFVKETAPTSMPAIQSGSKVLTNLERRNIAEGFATRARGWRSVACVTLDQSVDFEGRRVTVDLIAKGPDGAPLFVGVVCPRAAAPDGAQCGDLQRSAKAFGARFVALFDGRKLFWLCLADGDRLDACERDLVEMYASSAARSVGRAPPEESR